MIKKLYLFFFLSLFLLQSCSFDNKTGIWSGGKKERERLSRLEEDQKQRISIENVYSSKNVYSEEINLSEKIVLTEPKKNIHWKTASHNQQNFIGNLYLPSIENKFLKKKIGKNKHSISEILSSPLAVENILIYADDTGTIFNINTDGSINWKINIYKNIYKKIYKNLTFVLDKNVIYVADNVGFIYALSFDSGEIIWIKNHGIPLRSHIKVFKDKIFLINQDNRIICLKTDNGVKIWDVRTISSFIKSQHFLSVAISNTGYVIALNSAGDLIKIDADNGKVHWVINTSVSMYAHVTDFFISSEVVIDNEDIIFSSLSSMFSYKLENGYVNWEKKINSKGTPIVVGKNVFFVTDNGYFVIMNKNNGNIISSNNILKALKKKKRNTKVIGFIMGSGKIYSVTLNGYLIVSSALSGQVEYYSKVADSIISPPVINNGSLFILTKKPRIIGFN